VKHHVFITTILLSVLHLQGQYIDTIWEYVPAPGQYINTSIGIPSAADSLVGGLDGTLSLGAFGGYLVFSFEQPVENDPANPFGIDFTLFGNALPGWSEPGIVWIMEDENNNGLPDDTWYELAGSDHFFSSTKYDYQVTYTNPGAAADVPWNGSGQESGVIHHTSYHTQPYYPQPIHFPTISQESYVLGGTQIETLINDSDPAFLKSALRTFGYADNHPIGSPPFDLPDNPYTPAIENSGGDGFDISWAIDEQGRYVDLQQADFIKVQTGVLLQGEYLGEVSTEIRGAVDVAPGESISEPFTLINIKELPASLSPGTYPLEACVFRNGRYLSGEEILWNCNQGWASVDNNGRLEITGTGDVTITASLLSDATVESSVEVTVASSSGTSTQRGALDQPLVYPNPAAGFLSISIAEPGTVRITDMAGRLCMIKTVNGEAELDIHGLMPGMYTLLFISSETSASTRLIVKQQ
jgi:hypothetical protein